MVIVKTLLAVLACLSVSAWALDASLTPFTDAAFQAQALQLARTALVAWTHGQAPIMPSNLHPALLRQAGVFVSLETRRHQVRGCRGTLSPATGRLADEIVANVRQACALDPKHVPLRTTEINDVRIILCVPGQPGTVWPGQTWDAHTCGVLLEAGPRAAVMLPYEAPDSDHQVLWGRKKAGIAPGQACHMVCFEALRFAESFPETLPTPPSSPALPYW